MATDIEQMVLSISADTRSAVRALKKFGVDVNNVANDSEKAFTRPEKQVERLGHAMGKSSVQTANLAAQFQDIAVQLQSGTSPFTVALQQGTQISAALGGGQGGLGGTVKALGAAFLSVVSPVSLATIALITLGGVGVQYLTSLSSGTKDLDETLKEHKALISSIKEAYGDAAAGLEQYSRQSSDVLATQARASVAQLAASLQSEVESVLRDLGGRIGSHGQSLFKVDAEFAPFRDAIIELRKTAREGEPDIAAFRRSVAAIANADPTNKALQELAARVLDLTGDADRAGGALDAMRRGLDAITGSASVGAQAIQDYRAAIEDLSKIALPDLSPRQQADAAFAQAMFTAPDAAARKSAEETYAASLTRINTEEQKLADERAKREATRAAKRGARSTERDQERINQVIDGLTFEAEQLGRTAREQEIYNAVAAAGVDITSQYGQQIAGLAGHLYDMQAAQQQAIQQMDEMRSRASNVLSGFSQDIRNGVDAADALKNALGRVLDSVIDIGLQSAVTNLFGKSGTADAGLLGGLFSGLFGRAGGGPVQGGQAYTVGERGPETFIPNVSGRIAPNHARGQSSETFAPVYQIDARGSQMSEQQFRRILDENNRRVVAQVRGGVSGWVSEDQVRSGAQRGTG
ncbi:phage tail length tape measure family protein [Ancylobacter pratisalsi]|uniref:Bacteriophage tail tape measure N-terminal domain-containing protein n=1 Tax=Ancylobacter pratisalsi TaxID=1745854 RepID=A0A6P1YLJ6_9HYPH|nr:phage tail length tape measure family protein [Ancylobacter pratisalsi]QIB32634.1 hypothetical protein G3A50_02135 [Ancylobacter pratisalsi]